MKDNRGFTLVEILVVIAIMGVIGTGISLGFNFLSNANVGSVTEEINSELSTLRVQNMTKADRKYLRIRVDDGSYYKSYSKNQSYDSSDELGEKIASSSIGIYYVIGAAKTEITNNFTISFNRNGEVEYYINDGNDIISIDKILISNGDSKKDKYVVITPAGKHYTE